MNGFVVPYKRCNKSKLQPKSFHGFLHCIEWLVSRGKLRLIKTIMGNVGLLCPNNIAENSSSYRGTTIFKRLRYATISASVSKYSRISHFVAFLIIHISDLSF